jgi:hypothetical protein
VGQRTKETKKEIKMGGNNVIRRWGKQAFIALSFIGAATVSGCSAVSDMVQQIKRTFISDTYQEVAALTPAPSRMGQKNRGSLMGSHPDFGPSLGTIRPTKVNGVTHNVALRGGNGPTRRYVVQRADLQPMWGVDKSRDKAILAVQTAYGTDSCAGGVPLHVINTTHEVIGIWIIEAHCAPDASTSIIAVK